MPRHWLMMLSLTGCCLCFGLVQAQAQGRLQPADDMPVVRAAGGDIGMFFRFGGLSSMTHLGVNNNSALIESVEAATYRTFHEVLFHQAGIKFVFNERWMLPIFFGTGLYVVSPPQGDSQTSWGMEMGASLEYHFRIWRRISPFVGGTLAFGFLDPSGDGNFAFTNALGPDLGVEYFWGDRVSLSAKYQFLIHMHYHDNQHTIFGLATQTGGSMTLTYYF